MKPTDDLKEEHKAVKLMLRILDGVCTNIESGKSVKQEHLEELVEFMKIFVDRCHHTKEETYLFPEMEEIGLSGAEKLITSLKKEHEQGRQYVIRIEDAVSGKEVNKELFTILENLKAYRKLLTQHIGKEDENLFPMADAYLSQDAQKNLLKSFEAVETEIIGPGKHEEFHRWLHSMEEVYINPE